jgi:ribonuclease Z
MRQSFHPKLINHPLGDPGLFIPFLLERRAILFDMGELGALSVRDLLKISHVFISHTHVDHFIGFDTLLRHLIGREKELYIFGPEGFFRHVEGKLKGYTWNLVNEFENDFLLNAIEVNTDRMIKRSYSCRKCFEPEKENIIPFNRFLVKNRSFSVEAEFFDHRVPCMGFSLKEKFHININKDALKAMKLPVGPWLSNFKNTIYEGRDYDSDFMVTWEEEGRVIKEKIFRLGELVDKIASITPGIKITYITDIIGTPDNIERAIRFAKDSDHLFIEAPFLHRDREVARKKYHLTAKEAGHIAREAGVRRMTVFHFSPRYSHNPNELQKEAIDTFKGRVRVL